MQPFTCQSALKLIALLLLAKTDRGQPIPCANTSPAYSFCQRAFRMSVAPPLKYKSTVGETGCQTIDNMLPAKPRVLLNGQAAMDRGRAKE